MPRPAITIISPNADDREPRLAAREVRTPPGLWPRRTWSVPDAAPGPYIDPPILSKLPRPIPRPNCLARILPAAATILTIFGLAAAPAPCQVGTPPGGIASEAVSSPLRWQYAGGDAAVRETLHRIEQIEAGRQAERIAISAGVGTAVYYFHPLPPAAVIAESSCKVEVRSMRPGVQVFFSVSLPRTLDRRTGKPLALLVPGQAVRIPGGWTDLRVSNVPLGLEREIRPLRLQMGGLAIDARGAVIDGIVLNIFGGPGDNEVWIGNVELNGRVAPPTIGGQAPALASGASGGIRDSQPRLDPFTPRDPFSSPRTYGNPRADGNSMLAAAWSNAPFAEETPPLTAVVRGDADGGRGAAAPPTRIALQGSLLRIDGQPFFVRGVEYRGEPLDFLQRLGFNAVWTEQATEDLLREARERGIWVIARPQPDLLTATGMPGSERTGGRLLDPILAWDLGEQNSAAEVAALQQSADDLRRRDGQTGRLLAARPRTDLRAAGRAVDILIFGRDPAYTALSFRDYAAWLRGRLLLPRPGTPAWVTVQTQPDPAVVDQWRAAGIDTAAIDCLEPEQIRILTYLSLTAGARGLIYRSRSPLNSADRASRLRAAALELANRELAFIEPFLSGGQFVGMVESSRPEVTAALFRTDRARLLIPLWIGPGSQLVPGQSAAQEVTFVVPGVPDAYSAYLLLPGNMSPVQAQRVAGGMRVRLTECGPASLVVLTQDPLVLHHLSQRGSAAAARVAELWKELASETLRQVRAVYEQTARNGSAPADTESWFRMSAESLQAGDAALARGDAADAIRQYQRAVRPPALLRRVLWESAIDLAAEPTADPLTLSFQTLPWYPAWRERWSAAAWSENRLPGGDMESAEAWSSAGWQVYQYPVPGVESRARLLATGARSGNLGLCLSVLPNDPQRTAVNVESPPIWCESPPISVQTGDLVRIEGWVYISRPTSGSPDGLVIEDSIGGDALAVRIQRTVGWRPFRMDRTATQSGPLRLRIIMTGLGDACLDDVTVRTATPPGPLARRSTPRSPASTAAAMR